MISRGVFWNLYGGAVYFMIARARPYQRMSADVVDRLALDGHMRLLDAGCGPGYHALTASRSKYEGLSITGIDFSERMLELARRNCVNATNIELCNVDLCEPLPFPDRYFDRVLIVNALYSLPDASTVLKEFHRILISDGRLVIADPKPGARVAAVFASHIREVPLDILLMPFVLPLVALFNAVILSKRKKAEYHFRSESEHRDLLSESGFVDISIVSTYADQDWLISARKPESGIEGPCP